MVTSVGAEVLVSVWLVLEFVFVLHAPSRSKKLAARAVR